MLCYLGVADPLPLLLVAVLRLRLSTAHIIAHSGGADISSHSGKRSRLGDQRALPLQSLFGCEEWTENLYQASQSPSRKGKTRNLELGGFGITY